MNRVNTKNLGATAWEVAAADRVLELFPDREVYTCAAGISPSGIVHFGNFRDVMTSLMVAWELKRRGKNVRMLFSWDNFDRLRKVPVGIDEKFADCVGMPLSAVPDPWGVDKSYAEHFQKDFEKAMGELGIEMVFRDQTDKYTSGAYDDEMRHALRNREMIGEILYSQMSEVGIKEKNIDREEYVKNFYPISLYSSFTGKDFTDILDYDGDMTVTYRCKVTGNEETVNLREKRIAKLAWKIDWPMRWKYEDVVFEPGGQDHATPGGSYTSSSEISEKIYGRPAPVFVGYEFIGIQGLGAKMSGSKGNAVSPKMLLEIYQPELLKWLYVRKNPDQRFQLAFDSEIIRQYDEFDRECAAYVEGAIGDHGKRIIEYCFGGENKVSGVPLPFRQAVGFGQIVQWNSEKLQAILDDMNLDYTAESVATRLVKARNWIETYNPSELIVLRDEVNRDYVAGLSEQDLEQLRRLREELMSVPERSISELELLVYGIPKNPDLDQKENSVLQRTFFKHVYNLLISADTGPRLATFLWATDRESVLSLLAV